MTNTKLAPAIKPPTVYDIRKELPKGNLGGFVATSDSEINWAHTILLTATPILAIIGVIFVKPRWETLLFGFLMYVWSGLSITGGTFHCTITNLLRVSSSMVTPRILGQLPSSTPLVPWRSSCFRGIHQMVVPQS